MGYRDAIAKFGRTVEEKPMAIIKDFSLETTRRVVERTPVATGAAKGGWQPGLNTIETATTGRLDPTGTLVLTEAEQVIAEMKLGDEYSCANSVDHILPLEYGASQQAPAGMLGVTVAEAPLLARQIAAGKA